MKKSSVYLFKKITGLKSISGSLREAMSVNKDKSTMDPTNSVATEKAEVLEHQICINNRWMEDKYTFENGGSSAEFPTDELYLDRLEDGFFFASSSAWELDGDWIESMDYDKNAPIRRRKRKWQRALHYSEGSIPESDSTESMGANVEHDHSGEGKNGRTITSAGQISASSPSRTHASLKRESKIIADYEDGENDDEEVDEEVDEEDGLKWDEKKWETESNFGDGSSDIGESPPTAPGALASTGNGGWKRPVTARGRPGPVKGLDSRQAAARKSILDMEVTRLMTDPLLQVKNRKIKELAKQIRNLEKQSDKAYENEKSEWKKKALPKMQEQVQELEARVNELRKRIENEVELAGVPHIEMLEKELQAHVEVLEDVKKKMYFPFSPFSVGSGGVYCAFDDVWLEAMVGQVHIEMVPQRGYSCLSLVLNGISEEPDNSNDAVDEEEGPSAASGTSVDKKKVGMSVRFRIENFKSAGDSGKNIPKATLSEVDVKLSIVISALLSYDAEAQQWQCTRDDHLKLELIQFRGPFGFRKSMINGILQIAAPKILKKVLEILPMELGMFANSMPSPFEMRGTFDIRGTSLKVLTENMAALEDICRACEATPLQMAMFMAMQRYSMERGSYLELKSVDDVIKYMKKYRRKPKLWRSICFNWEQVCSIYCEDVQVAKAEEAMKSGAARFASKEYEIKFVDNIIRGVEHIKRKQIRLQMSVDSMVGQGSLNKFLRYFHQFKYRYMREEKESELQSAGTMNAKKVVIAKTLVVLDKIQSQYDKSMNIIRDVCRNYDFSEVKVRASLHSGNEGYMRVQLCKLFAQYPLLLDTFISKDKTIWGSLVPFKFAVRPQASGDVWVELAHVVEMEQPGTSASIISDKTEQPQSQQKRDSHASFKPLSERLSLFGANKGALASRELMVAKKGTAVLPVHIFNDFYSQICVSKVSQAEIDSNQLMLREERDADGLHMSDLEGVMSVLTLSARKPHISIIVDKQMSFKPGAELLSVMLGSNSKDKKNLPFGVPDMISEAEDVERVFMRQNMPPLFDEESTPTDFGEELIRAEIKAAEEAAARRRGSKGTNMGVALPFGGQSSKLAIDSAFSLNFAKEVRESVKLFEEDLQQQKNKERQDRAYASQKEMPVFVQTAPGIKMLLQVPKINVNISMSSLVRFFGAHFIDLSALQIWLEDITGGEFLEEHLAVGQVALERLAKYVLLPGLDITFNMNIRVIAQGCEVMLRFETPDVEGGVVSMMDEVSDEESVPSSPPTGSSDSLSEHSNIDYSSVPFGNSQHVQQASKGSSSAAGAEANQSQASLGREESNSRLAQEEKASVRGINHNSEAEEEQQSQPAAQIDLVINVMDVIDDCTLISKSIDDAKRAYAEYCSAKAMFGLSIDRNSET